MKNFGKIFKQPKKTAGAGMAAMLLIATPLTAQHEGLRLRSYLDPVGIPTICFGETQGVKMGQEKTVEQCHEMLTLRLGFFGAGVDYLVQPPMTPQTHAALTSFAYNVGLDAFEKSSVLRLYNEGRGVEACNFLTRYIYANGKIFSGLVKRRDEERKLCLSGL